MNYDKAGILLHILEKTNPQDYPKLKAIHALAMMELEDLAVEADKELNGVLAAKAKAVKDKAEEDRIKALPPKTPIQPGLEPTPTPAATGGIEPISTDMQRRV